MAKEDSTMTVARASVAVPPLSPSTRPITACVVAKWPHAPQLAHFGCLAHVVFVDLVGGSVAGGGWLCTGVVWWGVGMVEDGVVWWGLVWWRLVQGGGEW